MKDNDFRKKHKARNFHCSDFWKRIKYITQELSRYQIKKFHLIEIRSKGYSQMTDLMCFLCPKRLIISNGFSILLVARCGPFYVETD